PRVRHPGPHHRSADGDLGRGHDGCARRARPDLPGAHGGSAMTVSATPPQTEARQDRRVRHRVSRRHRLVLGCVIALWLLLFGARTLLGDFTITIPDFVRIVFGADIPPATFILMQSKLPAAVVGTLAGLAF